MTPSRFTTILAGIGPTLLLAGCVSMTARRFPNLEAARQDIGQSVEKLRMAEQVNYLSRSGHVSTAVSLLTRAMHQIDLAEQASAAK